MTDVIAQQYQWADFAFGEGCGKNAFQTSINPKTENGFDEMEFMTLLQAEISPRTPHAFPAALNSITSAPALASKSHVQQPVVMNVPLEPQYLDPSNLTVDPYLLNFDFTNFPAFSDGDFAADPLFGGFYGQLPPAPTGVISEPGTPVAEIQTPILPTTSELPSLMSSANPSAAVSPAPIEEPEANGEQEEETDESMPQQPEGPLTITFEHESATEVQDTRNNKSYQNLSFRTLTSDDNLRVYSACPPPPPQSPQSTQPPSTLTTSEPTSSPSDDKQVEFNRSLKTHLWKAYPHDHHVVFTLCGHEDRFFAFVESHLKMCVCDRLSRVFTDIRVVDRERANMEGEIGSWRVFNAGLEKETIEGLCPTCEKKNRKTAKKGVSGKRKAGSETAAEEKKTGEKREATAPPTTTGGLLKHKRPYKRRKQEGQVIEETITVKHYTRAKRSKS